MAEIRQLNRSLDPQILAALLGSGSGSIPQEVPRLNPMLPGANIPLSMQNLGTGFQNLVKGVIAGQEKHKTKKQRDAVNAITMPAIANLIGGKGGPTRTVKPIADMTPPDAPPAKEILFPPVSEEALTQQEAEGTVNQSGLGGTPPPTPTPEQIADNVQNFQGVTPGVETTATPGQLAMAIDQLSKMQGNPYAQDAMLQLASLMQGQQPEFGFMQADEGIFRTDKSTGKVALAHKLKPKDSASKPHTKIAKARHDLKRDLITQDEFDKIKADAFSVDSSKVATGKTHIWDNGTVMNALKDGTVEVLGPDGKKITDPKKRIEAIKAANKHEATQAGLESGAKAAGAAAIERSEQAVTSLEKVKASTENIDEAIAALDDGAKTGAIMSKLPSIRAASIRLDNVRGRMGLDIISDPTLTFGALSENELLFALDTALPVGLDEVELRKWLVAKGKAQKKLANYLEDVALFLGTPGNTTADWVRIHKDIREESEAQKKSGKRFRFNPSTHKLEPIE